MNKSKYERAFALAWMKARFGLSNGGGSSCIHGEGLGAKNGGGSGC